MNPLTILEFAGALVGAAIIVFLGLGIVVIGVASLKTQLVKQRVERRRLENPQGGKSD